LIVKVKRANLMAVQRVREFLREGHEDGTALYKNNGEKKKKEEKKTGLNTPGKNNKTAPTKIEISGGSKGRKQMGPVRERGPGGTITSTTIGGQTTFPVQKQRGISPYPTNAKNKKGIRGSSTFKKKKALITS